MRLTNQPTITVHFFAPQKILTATTLHPRGMRQCYQLARTLDGPQNPSGYCEEERKPGPYQELIPNSSVYHVVAWTLYLGTVAPGSKSDT